MSNDKLWMTETEKAATTRVTILWKSIIKTIEPKTNISMKKNVCVLNHSLFSLQVVIGHGCPPIRLVNAHILEVRLSKHNDNRTETR